ncbi:hypothetical protein [Polluticoccus soli]|uniref:hypothetical protein n=1 Tax=Polluticoccus soli TaxID=3034150 RepID=UPI0023E0DCF9|nr:hypothetical protein [Flavipsychrobacter sp. JY13-12]
MKHISTFCLSIAMSLGALSAGAQGSGDPGLSAIGGLRSGAALAFDEETYENDRVELNLGHTMAKGERDVVINMPHAAVRIPLHEHGYLDTRLPFYATRGELAKIGGIGDLTVAYTHFLPYADGFSWQFTGGVELGLTNASLTDGKGRGLPMVYQPGQGSTDLILGASGQYKDFVSFAVGYQQPIIRYNGNDYLRSSPINELGYSNADYPLSRQLYRNGDLMLRVEGHLTGTRAGISAGPLVFYHLRNDLYLDINNNYRESFDSKGFTMNLAGSAFYRMGRYGQWKVGVYGAVPIAERDFYPDGTSRQWLIMPNISYFFGQDALLFE